MLLAFVFVLCERVFLAFSFALCEWVQMHADKFEKMFSMQEGLNERIGVFTRGMDEADQIKWVLNYSRALSQELAELTDSVPWKWWAKYQKFDKQNAQVEVVDLFHFVISLAQTLGMSAEDVFDKYMKKNRVNNQRQDAGYAVKDEKDNLCI